MMMKYINILILLVTISSVMTAPNKGYKEQKMEKVDIDNHKNIQDSLNGLLCPPIGLRHKFEVATIQTTTPMYGCTFMERDERLSAAPLFHLWLERPVPTMVHGHCNDMQNMDHIIFECLSKDNMTNTVLADKGWKFTSLLEHTVDEKSQNVTKSVFYRCAVYDVQDIEQGVRIIRLVISNKRAKKLHVSQCEGLANLLGENALPYLPEGQREWADGSMYLYLIGRNLDKSS